MAASHTSIVRPDIDVLPVRDAGAFDKNCSMLYYKPTSGKAYQVESLNSPVIQLP
jgi:hypothetical protein